MEFLESIKSYVEFSYGKRQKERLFETTGKTETRVRKEK